MNIPTIHVHTAIDKSTVPFAKFMWETMLSLANRPNDLRLTVHCMGPAALARIVDWPGKNESMVTPCGAGDPLHGSRGHGVCVMEALGMMGDGDIHVVADSDTVIVAKGWDDYLRTRLLNDGIAIVGSTYEDMGGFSSGDAKTQTYKKIPTLTWCALSPLHDWRSLEVLPDKGKQIVISSEEQSRIYNLPLGYTVFGDVGWQLPRYLHDHKLRYEGWRQLKPTKDAVVLRGLSDYHEEFHVNDIPFVTHHRGSMTHAYRSNRLSNSFYAAVDKHLIDENAGTSRFQWSGFSSTIPTFNEKQIQPEPIANTNAATRSYVAQGKEWLKVTYSGDVVLARKPVDRTSKLEQLQLKFETPKDNRVGHLRIEGVLEFDYQVVIPPTTRESYLLTIRNMTGSPVLVCSTTKSDRFVTVPPDKTWFVLVDVDGTQRVE